jgi:hypothetical protein
MADLSKADVINEYPIEGRLDIFRESFRSACADSGYHEALGVAQHFDNESKAP